MKKGVYYPLLVLNRYTRCASLRVASRGIGGAQALDPCASSAALHAARATRQLPAHLHFRLRPRLRRLESIQSCPQLHVQLQLPLAIAAAAGCCRAGCLAIAGEPAAAARLCSSCKRLDQFLHDAQVVPALRKGHKVVGQDGTGGGAGRAVRMSESALNSQKQQL